jgi:hypothetical protein
MTPSPVWREIESAPKDGTPILISGGTFCHPDSMGGPEPFRGVSIARWDRFWNEWSGNPTSHDDCLSHEPTHWMPLPPPPTQEQTDDRS